LGPRQVTQPDRRWLVEYMPQGAAHPRTRIIDYHGDDQFILNAAAWLAEMFMPHGSGDIWVCEQRGETTVGGIDVHWVTIERRNYLKDLQVTPRQRRVRRQRCGNLMIGSGTDTYDPTCDLPEGHEGDCKSVGAIGQFKITTAERQRIWRETL
jgi:hypothetical protein